MTSDDLLTVAGRHARSLASTLLRDARERLKSARRFVFVSDADVIRRLDEAQALMADARLLLGPRKASQPQECDDAVS